jgi:deoxyribodipyrimidine photolyase-related protein
LTKDEFQHMADRPSLILILGDQLTRQISSLRAADKDRDVVLMCELRDETSYVGHTSRSWC